MYQYTNVSNISHIYPPGGLRDFSFVPMSLYTIQVFYNRMYYPHSRKIKTRFSVLYFVLLL